MYETPYAGAGLLSWLSSVDPGDPRAVILGHPLPSLETPLGLFHSHTHRVTPLPFFANNFRTAHALILLIFFQTFVNRLFEEVCCAGDSLQVMY